MAVSREQIADAFERRVERFGYAKTTLDEIAADLHISKKTIYVHFDGKAAIYRHIVERIARMSRSELARQVEGLPTYAEKLAGVVRLVIGTARAHVLETEAAEWRAQFVVAEDAFRQAFGSLLAEILTAGAKAGEFAGMDAALATRMIGAMVIEYTLMLREDPALDRDEELVAAIARFAG